MTTKRRDRAARVSQRRRRWGYGVAAALGSVLAAALAVLVLAGGGGGAGRAPMEAGANPAAAAGELAATTLDGSAMALTGPRQKPLIVYFMAGWCTTCIPEGIALGRLQERLGDRIDIVSVSIEPTESRETLAPFQEAVGNPAYEWVLDRDGRIASHFDVRFLDTTLIIDTGGEVVYRDEYSTPYEQLREALAKVL